MSSHLCDRLGNALGIVAFSRFGTDGHAEKLCRSQIFSNSFESRLNCCAVKLVFATFKHFCSM